MPPKRNALSKSSIFRKLPADLRKQIDAAIVERGPGQATYREIYDKFHLDKDFDVGFTAFKRYARTAAWNARLAEQQQLVRETFPSTRPPFLPLIRRTTKAMIAAVLNRLLDEESPPSAQQLYYLGLVLAAQQHILEAFEQRHEKLRKQQEDREYAEATAGIPSLFELTLMAQKGKKLSAEEILQLASARQSPPEPAQEKQGQPHDSASTAWRKCVSRVQLPHVIAP